MKKNIPPKVMRALEELYEGLDPMDIFSLAEVLRMMGKDEMMRDSDPDAMRVYDILYYVMLVLKSAAEAKKEGR